MKKGVRIVNCARGELIDGEALRKAIESGKVAGAALDVFQTEPPVGEPLLEFENVLATPHIGGSTEEAQEAVGVRIAEQVRDYLRDGIALNAVNVPAMTAEQYRTVQPYAALAERLGTLRRPRRHRKSAAGAPGISRQNRGPEHAVDPQRGAGGSAQPVARAQSKCGERGADRSRSRTRFCRTA